MFRFLNFLEQSPAVALSAKHERSPLQFVYAVLALGDLAESDSVLSSCIFQFRQTELHRQHNGIKSLAESVSLFALAPVGEICRISDRILYDDVLDPILQVCSPTQHAFNTGGIGRDDSDCSKADAECLNVLEHGIKPAVCDLARAGSHVGQQNRSATLDVVNERIQACCCVDVYFYRGSVEVVRQAATSLVLGVEVEQLGFDFLRGEPFGKCEHEASLTDSPFAAHCQDHALCGVLHWYY